MHAEEQAGQAKQFQSLSHLGFDGLQALVVGVRVVDLPRTWIGTENLHGPSTIHVANMAGESRAMANFRRHEAIRELQQVF